MTIGKINVLDKGFVVLHDMMGTDLTVVNAARCSYDTKSLELTDGDRRLIAFLAREGHLSPYRHAMLQFEFNTPLLIARQHWKYVVGSDHTMDAWNESSRRYVKDKVEFYLPTKEEWRTKPANSKQGSGVPLSAEEGLLWTNKLAEHQAEGERLYEEAMDAGIAPELARLFLPAYGLYVKYYWTASLASVCHMLNQRLAHDSQYEFQLYAKAVLELIKPHFPVSVDALVNEGGEA